MESMLQKTEISEVGVAMLEEHKSTWQPPEALQASTAEGHAFARLAQRLILHAQTEEEIPIPRRSSSANRLRLGKA
jgi:hypothetical protein